MIYKKIVYTCISVLLILVWSIRKDKYVGCDLSHHNKTDNKGLANDC